MTKKIILAVILGLLSTVPAFAHAHLVTAVPAVGGVVGPVADIRLTFSERVEVKFSTIKLSDAAGQPLSAPAATIDPQDGRILHLALAAPLAPGDYKVSWTVVSVDTHRTTGSFTFSVQP